MTTNHASYDNSYENSSKEVVEDLDNLKISSSQIIEKNSYEGFLYKWTNYIYGWQKRYVILNNGILSYSLDPKDIETNFHGVLSLAKVNIKVNSKDDLRFDVSSTSSCYYFRAETPEERMIWVNKIICERETSWDVSSSRRTSSLTSINSVSSLSSLISFSHTKNPQLNEMVSELNQMKDNLFQQIDNLQNYYDLISNFVRQQDEGSNIDEDEDTEELLVKNEPKTLIKVSNIGAPGFLVRRPLGHRYTRSSTFNPPEFNGPILNSNDRIALHRFLVQKQVNLSNEISSFRMTTVGLMSNLSSCLELMEGNEKNLQSQIEKERAKNTKLSNKIRQLTDEANKRPIMSGPDSLEGPTLRLNNEEFYDAFETAISAQDQINSLTTTFIEVTETVKNPYEIELSSFIGESLNFLTSSPHNDTSWTLYMDDPPTKIYKKEILIDDIVVDPYRVIHLYKGLSAKELCHYFWDVDYRLQTDNTVEYVFVKAKYEANIIVVHQLHKHIWPATRRDSCFVSKLDQIYDSEVSKSLTELFTQLYKDESEYDPVGTPWIVANFSVDLPEVLASNCIRVDAKVCFLAQTFIVKNSNYSERDNYYTMANYCASINPGGWLPHSAIRAVARRELPKFVKKLGEVSSLNASKIPIDV